MTPSRLDRRSFLWNAGGGLGGVALAHLLGAEGLLAGTLDAKGRGEFRMFMQPLAGGSAEEITLRAAEQVVGPAF